MAIELEQLVVQLNADMRKYVRDLANAWRTTDHRLRDMENRFDKATERVNRSASRMAANLRNAVAGLAVAFVTREVGRAADSWNRYENQIAAAGVEHGRLNATMAENLAIARRSRSDLGATIQLYARLKRSTAELGAAFNDAQLSRAVEIVNKAFVAGGAADSERRAGVLQLSQGLQSGFLQGDELRSIRENAPLLAQAIADEFGVTIGALKELGAQGALTTDVLVRAILNGGDKIERAFGSMRRTVADSFTVLRNETTAYIAQMDDSVGATERLSAAIAFVAENIELFGDAAVVVAATVGGALAGRAMVALVAQATAAAAVLAATTVQMTAVTGASRLATGSFIAMRGAMAFLGGPWVILITAIATALGLLVIETRKSQERWERFDQTLENARSTLSDTERLLGRATDNMRGLSDVAEEAATYIRGVSGALEELPSRAEPMFIRIRVAMDRAMLQADLDELAADRAREQQRLSSESIRGARLGQPALTTSPELERLDREIAARRAELARADEQLTSMRNDPQPGISFLTPRLRPTPPAEDPNEVVRRQIQQLQATDEARGLAGLEPRNAEAIERLRVRQGLLDAGMDQATVERAMQIADQLRAQRSGEAAREAEIRERLEYVDALADNAKRKYLDDLYFGADVARLSGNEMSARAAERQAFIYGTAEDLSRPVSQGGTGMSFDDAFVEAQQRAEAIDYAEVVGGFRDAFRGGVRAALEGDLDGFLVDSVREAWIRGVTSALDPLADALFEVFAGVWRGVGGELGRVLSGAFGIPLLGNVLHGGGMAGTGPMRAVPAAAFAGAPRLHMGGGWGLRPDEHPAILQQGERVLNRAESAAYGRERAINVPVTIVTPHPGAFRGSQVQISRQLAGAVQFALRGS